MRKREHPLIIPDQVLLLNKGNAAIADNKTTKMDFKLRNQLMISTIILIKTIRSRLEVLELKLILTVRILQVVIKDLLNLAQIKILYLLRI